MFKKVYIVAIAVCSFMVSVSSQDMHKRYEKAEELLPRNVRNKIYNRWVTPNSIKETQSFWYKVNTPKGEEYWILDYSKKTKKPAFDQEKLAKSLSDFTKKDVKPYKLGISGLEFLPKEQSIKFKKDTFLVSCSLIDYQLKELTKPVKIPKTENYASDSSYIAFIDENNIWLKNPKTEEKFQLTTDGTELYPYGGYISWYFTKNENINQQVEFEIDITWSNDNKKLLIARYDRREAQKLFMYKSLPKSGWRSEVYSYYRPIAGDSIVPSIEYYVADVETKKVIKTDLKPIPTFTDYGSKWSEDNQSIYKLYFERGWQKVYLTKTNANTGKTKVVYSEETGTYIDPGLVEYHLINNEKEVLWLSEKDGWNHIYRINTETGNVINQVTKGEFVVRDVKHIDKKAQKIYFTANGKENGRDPYFEHLYVTDFTGKNIKLLTPENAYHTVSFTEDKKYFVDNFSRIDQPNKTILRKAKDGKFVMKVEETNTTSLDSTNINYPEAYEVKGRDGKTAIYGAIFRPTDFDPNKKYPVIDYTYSGPQTIVTPKTFGRGILNMNHAIAELGFIVVTVDGMGSAFRSKAFHDFSYKNLGDIGGPDHIAAIKQLAEKYPYMDTTRVGIYGHSAGGYDAARALIAYNNFYKVAVSGAGNHDHRVAKAWWPEVYMGYPVGKHYDEQSNILNASKLKGKLMLAHGDMDNNVNPAGSTRFAAELIKANKDFELVLIPGADHGGLWWDSYFIRKRWDFFVKNLLGAEPPYEYKID